MRPWPGQFRDCVKPWFDVPWESSSRNFLTPSLPSQRMLTSVDGQRRSTMAVVGRRRAEHRTNFISAARRCRRLRRRTRSRTLVAACTHPTLLVLAMPMSLAEARERPEGRSVVCAEGTCAIHESRCDDVNDASSLRRYPHGKPTRTTHRRPGTIEDSSSAFRRTLR